ncbi:MAG: DUF1501 domain-containing protein [Saprospiraceae bacterium]|nr:DUF1501 domain-containing protein [Saprospiraceae bacterium]
MKRRNFLKILPPLGITPFVVNGFPLKAYANQRLAQILSTCDGVEDRVLVLIQLKGGNDGVNTVIPINQYDTYANLRPTIRISDTGNKKYIDLDTTLPSADQVGLHPAMTGFKEIYDEGQLALVQGVGYAQPNQSHFKSTDLWLTGGDGTPENFNIGSGWMGRALQAFYPEVTGAPTATMPDPLGIQVGDPNPSLGFHTETEHQNVINLSGQDPAGFFSLVQTIGGAPILNIPDTEQGDELAFIMGVEQSVNLYAQRITDVFNAGSNAITYPETNLASQLKTIARMIKGGCKTKIYLCSLGGFDNHSSQADPIDTSTGVHSELLLQLSDAVKAFLDDLEALGISEQVLGCTFSEFGRCAAENGSIGTDHGTLAPMFVFGKNAQAGVLGTNVNLSNLTQDNQLQGIQHDYRQVFATLLQDWLGADGYVMEQTMFDGYTKVGLVDAAFVVNPDCYFGGGTSGAWEIAQAVKPLQVFPNPASYNAEVSFESPYAFPARLSLHSLGGSMVYANTVQVSSGTNFYYLDVANLPAGAYFVRLENKNTGTADVTKLTVAR